MIPNESIKNNHLQELKDGKTKFSTLSSDLKENYYELCKNLNIKDIECNNCHSKHCQKHGYYERYYLITSDDLKNENNKVKILRVKCTECQHTHAILPEEIVPYQQYSLIFIVTALVLHYVQNKSIRKVCSLLDINERTFFKWAKTFKKQLIIYLGILSSLTFSFKNELIRFCSYSKYVRDFGADFLRKTDRVFMQTHKNPPNYHIPKYLLLF